MFAYFVLLTLGELFVIPVGLTLIESLAPVRFASMAMGGWYIAKFLGSLLAGVHGRLLAGHPADRLLRAWPRFDTARGRLPVRHGKADAKHCPRPRLRVSPGSAGTHHVRRRSLGALMPSRRLDLKRRAIHELTAALIASR